jgi:hypothetical protein
MRETSATYSGSPHTHISNVMGGGVIPPPPSPPIRTTIVQTPTTSGSGTIPSMTLTIVPSIDNVSNAHFQYGMSDFDSSSVLTYSTLQNIGLGAGSYNSSLQGSVAGTTSLFNIIPYSGVHIPPSSPSLGGAFQQLIGPNTNSSWFSGGNHGLQSYMNLVGYIPLSLFDAFGNNAFSSSALSIGDNPIFGQPNPMQGLIPS